MDQVQKRDWFDSREFANEFHTEAPLGAFCGERGTAFRLWAPTADGVSLRLFRAGDGGTPEAVVSMQRQQRGCWVYTTERNLDGWYYDYAVSYPEGCLITQDPYARSCGINGERSMVLDLRTTDPEEWHQDAAPAPGPQPIIWEVHIKDFSWDPVGGFAPEDRGRYSALTRLGTTLNCDGIHPTGLSYLKELGVTHIQILPMYDYGSVDESAPDSGYNWGYDPVNYNAPEGSYSSNPRDGRVRVRELKEMIAALHSSGFRVIMDVVYNHTYSLDSCLWKTVPGYFYRQDDRGDPTNGSGCGNDIATERSMCSRYILDSVLYWAEEYHIDGFRFDLMGLMDVLLMNRIREELDKKYGRGEKLLYGEPWRAAETRAAPGTVLGTKENLRQLDIQIGAFSDDIRDSIKGSVMDLESRGFVNGGSLDANRLSRCVTGFSGGKGIAVAPSQVISYLSCHDDWTLWDKLVYTLDPEKNYSGQQPQVLRANKLAALLNFCCQGRLFFQAGEEFGRTKDGIKNSYCSSAEINRLDWTRAWRNRELVDFYRGLIALRKQLPGLTDCSPDAPQRLLWSYDLGKNCAAVCLDNRGEGGSWQELLFIVNCGERSCKEVLPEGPWQLLADIGSAFRWQEACVTSGAFQLEPMSALLLGKL